jgi:hypothetical protein
MLAEDVKLDVTLMVKLPFTPLFEIAVAKSDHVE